MEMHDLLKKISELSVLTESKKEETHKGGTKSSDDGVTKHKGKYGTEYQGDEDDESEDGKKKKKDKAADAPKRGRGRPRKDADSSTGQVAQYKNAASLQSFMVGNLPKDKSGKPALPGKASKKHSLKEWFDEIDRRAIAEQTPPLKPGEFAIPTASGEPVVVQSRDTSTKGQALAKFMSAQAAGGQLLAKPTADSSTTDKSVSSTSTVATAMKEGESDSGDKKWIKGAIKKPGAFTKKAAAHGKSTAEFAKDVLAHKEKYPAKTEKQAVLAKTLSKLSKGKKSVKEVEMPPKGAEASPFTYGSKIEETPKAKSPAKKTGNYKNSFHEGKKAKPDFPDVDDDGNRKESIKSAAASAKKHKKMMKEASDSCRAAYHEGKCHAFENGHYRCRYDEGMEESKHYHRGFMEGLDECYGGRMVEEGMGEMFHKPDSDLTPIEPFKRPASGTSKAATRVHGIPGSDIPTGPQTMGQKLRDIGQGLSAFVRGKPEPTNEGGSPLGFDDHDPLNKLPPGYKGPASANGTDEVVHREGPKPGFRNPKEVGALMDYTPKGRATELELDEDQFMAELDALDEEMENMDEGGNKYLGARRDAIRAGKDTFSVDGKMHRVTGDTSDEKMGESMNDLDISEDPMMESWSKQLAGLLNEGMTVTTSTGHPSGQDSVSISATDGDAHKLLQIIQNAGLSAGSSRAAAADDCETSDYSDESHGEEESPLMARPRGFGMSQNVEPEIRVVEPYDYDEISSALGSGGSAMSALRKRLLALESKGGMEMPDGKGMSVQSEEDEPHGTPETPQPYDVEEVQSALEKGGKKISADKTGKKSDTVEELEESFAELPVPRGMGMSVGEGEPDPVAPKLKKRTTQFQNSKSKRKVSEAAEKRSGVPVLASPAGFGFSQGGDTEPQDVKPKAAHHSDDVQTALETGHDKTETKKSTSSKDSSDEVSEFRAILKRLHKSADSGSQDGKKWSDLESMHEKLDESEMPMPDGNGFSVQAKEEPMPESPADCDVTDLNDVLSDLEAKDSYQQDEFERAFSALKSLIGKQMGSEKSKTASDSSSEKQTDHDSDEEKVKESSSRCDECGAMYEGSHEDHVCNETAEKLDEWANSMRSEKDPGQIADESFSADTEYMMNDISGGINRRKQDQTVMPYTSVKIRESGDEIDQLRRLSGTR